MDVIKTPMTPDQSFFAVFCIEQVADELNIQGNKLYKIFTEDSDILDSYIIPHYDVLHTQSRDWIVEDIVGIAKAKGLLK